MSRPALDPRPGAPTWSQAPGVPRGRGRTHPILLRVRSLVAALWIALVGPLAFTATVADAMFLQIIGSAVVALVAVALLPRRWWWAPLAIAAFAGFIAGHGRVNQAWMLLGLLLAMWVGLRRPPLPSLREDVHVALPVIALTTVAAWQLNHHGGAWPAVVPFAVACALPLAGPVVGRAIDTAARAVGRAAQQSVSAVCFLAAGGVVVVVPWILRRPLGRDPFTTGGGWIERERRPLLPERPWADDATPRPPRSGRRWRPVVMAAGAGTLVVTVAAVHTNPARESGGTPGLLPRAEAAEPRPEWYVEYRDDVEWALDERVALRPLEVYRLRDVETRHVNVRGGYRVSWSPPECDCRRLRVWMYGGSGAFGFEQRDEHTIASELSRLAAREGLSVQVDNRGIPGQLHWRSALRFAWDLIDEPAPDLVVFYEGSEEVHTALELVERGLHDVRAPYEPYVEALYDEIHHVGRRPPEPEGVEYLGWPVVTDTGRDGDAGELAAVRYAREAAVSRIRAFQSKIPARYFWQPAEALRSGSDADRATQEAFRSASEHLPDEVVDLSRLLADRSDVGMIEGDHTDERGAAVVAAAILDELRPQLTALARSGRRA